MASKQTVRTRLISRSSALPAPEPRGSADSLAVPSPQRVGTVRIGISGWNYTPWRGVFYPPGLKQREELTFAASRFSTIEINGTFYSLQRPSSFARWAAETPPGFVFSIKGPRFITHMKKLRDVEQPLANFFASGLLALGSKLGPILWQFPPQFPFHPERLEAFFQLLPTTTEDAAVLSRRHGERLIGRALTETDQTRPLRYAIEIRHNTCVVPEFVALLRRYGIALVCADTVEWPRLVDATTDFVYLRLHGSRELYASGYGRTAIATWADRIRAWTTGEPPSGPRVAPFAPSEAIPHDVYCYFDNDIKVRAPFDAEALERRVRRLALASR